ncbi:MAG: MarR family transcriptional regulator [Rhodospirillaceae bacterium]|nr:MarR family transcriptional regulator [Rhodospirillaceae bacterium]
MNAHGRKPLVAPGSGSADSPPTRPNSVMDPTHIFDVVEFRDAYRISYLANAVVLPGYEAVKHQFGLNRGEYLLILCLAHYPMLTAQDVARLSRRPRNTISRAVHRLVDDGYIKRAPDPEDGRQARLTITPAGRALNNEIAVVFRKRQEKILSALTGQERQILDVLLQKVAVHTAISAD